MSRQIQSKRVLFAAAFFLCILSGCAVKDWGSVKQAYRDFVSYYNAYFHAEESLNKAIKSLSDNHTDNYDEVLDVYRIGDENAASAVSNDLQRAEDKATKLIQGYENSNWVSDSYLLIGKARYYRQDYQDALESFRFISSNMRGTDQGYEAMIWIIKTNTRMERYNEARSMVSVINSMDGFPETHKKSLNLAIADLQIKRNSYSEAITSLEKVVKEISKDRDKSRYYFILGQLYQQRGDLVSANELYTKVARRPPSYEMEFQAQFNKILTMEVNNISQYREKRRYINNMTGDSKNEKFMDLLYYELARLELFMNNEKNAIDLLNKSLAYNTENEAQKGRTLYLLADLNYRNENYFRSNHQYKTLLNLIETGFSGSDTMESRAVNYTDITGYYVTIHMEDSLQKLAELDEETLRKTLQATIEAEEKREKDDQRRQQQFAEAGNDDAGRFEQTIQTDGDWYFYNPRTLRSGLQQFQRQYGERPLVDNWRFRSIGEDGQTQHDQITDDERFNDEETDDAENMIEEMMAEIPRSGAMKNASDNQIMQAYFNLGYAYYEQVRDYPKTIEVFETLQSRFPDNRFTANSYYLIYQSAHRSGNEAKAEEYKNKLRESFPGSEFTALATNPEQYQRELTRDERNPELERIYSDAYTAFNQRNCSALNNLSAAADTVTMNNYLLPNFEYLSLLCRIVTDETDRNYKPQLESFIENNPETEVTAHAKNVLAYLEGDRKSGENETGRDISMFTNISSERHFYMLIFEIGEGDVNSVQKTFSDYHSQQLRGKNLRTSNVMVGREHQAVMVRDFENRSEALSYYKKLSENENFKTNIDLDSFEAFVISATNFSTLMDMENKQDYLAFFKKYYE